MVFYVVMSETTCFRFSKIFVCVMGVHLCALVDMGGCRSVIALGVGSLCCLPLCMSGYVACELLEILLSLSPISALEP